MRSMVSYSKAAMERAHVVAGSGDQDPVPFTSEPGKRSEPFNKRCGDLATVDSLTEQGAEKNQLGKQ